MRRRLTTGVLAVLALLMAATPAAPQSPPTVTRIAGDTRIETAIAISRADYADGQADAVVLARSDEYADALAGGPLAAAKDAPLLLTSRTELVQGVRDEIRRVLASGRTVYVLGGEAALSADVHAALRDLGYAPVRLQGDNRYDTSLAIAREAAPAPGFITVATGNGFPDALIAGSLAAAFRDGVMVLTDGDRLPPSVRSYLDDHAAADATTVGPAAAAAHPSAYNVSGPSPVARSVAAAEAFYGGLDPAGVALASAERFPDGLAGAAHAFRAGRMPLLLTPAAALPAVTSDYVRSLDASGASHVYGGTAAISADVVSALQSALES